ncbi:hypothetical protein K0M31_005608 [Melipona bicolor]|uniref:Uncharacterized protein n=1 Tax=Melipona bicolor TaxID=60889 RepID=A0AA40KLY0_9HYME|nr:hypothetical protein K0M31_005608 [Melipona bicolor]
MEYMPATKQKWRLVGLGLREARAGKATRHMSNVMTQTTIRISNSPKKKKKSSPWGRVPGCWCRERRGSLAWTHYRACRIRAECASASDDALLCRETMAAVARPSRLPRNGWYVKEANYLLAMGRCTCLFIEPPCNGI